MTKPSELRDLTADELRQREHELDDQLFRLRMQKAMGQLDVPIEGAHGAARAGAGDDDPPREEQVGHGRQGRDHRA